MRHPRPATWILAAASCLLTAQPGLPSGGPLAARGHQEPSQKKTDARTGLAVDEGLELVKAKCLSCHSSRLILQNRGTREHWSGMIQWMEQTQGLERLDSKDRDEILTYLERNYGIEQSAQRRAPLAADLLPPP